jgi:hypothetical protein
MTAPVTRASGCGICRPSRRPMIREADGSRKELTRRLVVSRRRARIDRRGGQGGHETCHRTPRRERTYRVERPAGSHGHCRRARDHAHNPRAPRGAPCAGPSSGVRRTQVVAGWFQFQRAARQHRSLALVALQFRRMTSLRSKLVGPDRRSLRGVATVVRLIGRDPRRVSELVAALSDRDPGVRMRAADALEKVSAERPALIGVFTSQLLRLAATAHQQEIRWHLAQMMPRLSLSGRERGRVARSLRRYLADPSSIVRTCALQALAELSFASPRLWPDVKARLEDAVRTGTPAMRARARRLLTRRARAESC